MDRSWGLSALADDVRQHDSVFWRRAIRAGVVYGPDAFVRYSPPLFGMVFMGALGGHRRAVRANLRRAYGGRRPLRETVDMARLFASYASCLTEAFVTATGRGGLTIHVVGDEHYDAAVAKGRGIILATAHTGGWHAAGSALSVVHREEVLVVMQRERDERAQSLQDDGRTERGARFIRIGSDPLDALPLLSHLRRRGAVALQIDRVPPTMRGRSVELLGEQSVVPEGPLQLAAVSGAPIVPFFGRRVGLLQYEFSLQPGIELPRRPSAAELDTAAAALAGSLERFVRAHPTQWFHFEGPGG